MLVNGSKLRHTIAMTDAANNIILTQLRAIRDEIGDVRNRLGNIETMQANALQQMGNMALAHAQTQVTLDRQASRLGRIETRLGLIDTPAS
jgi:hypothetical protein